MTAVDKFPWAGVVNQVSTLDLTKAQFSGTEVVTGVMAADSAKITGGTINGATIGATTPAAGTFTTLNADILAAAPTYTFAGGVTRGLNVFVNDYGTLTDGKTAYLNAIVVNNDQVDARGAQGGGLTGCNIAHNMNGTLIRGGRTALGVSLIQTRSTANPSGNEFYVANGVQAVTSVNDNGTEGSSHGNLFAQNNYLLLKTGATFWKDAIVGEDDIGVQAGASATYKVGRKIVLLQSDAVRGSLSDAGLSFSAQATNASPGWKVGVGFGQPEGWWPFGSDSALLGTEGAYPGGPAYACAYGVDFSAVTFSGAAFKSTGFSVDGAGGVVAASIKITPTTPASAGAAGVAGQIAVDAGYIYVCTATNTWKRAALSSW